MSQWLELISTVRFDLEEGPVVDFSFPSQNFSQDFIKKLAYPAFPDSYTLLCDDKMFFSFMIKAKKIDRLNYIYTSSQVDLSKEEDDINKEVEELDQGKDDQKIIQDYNESKKSQYIKGKECNWRNQIHKSR